MDVYEVFRRLGHKEPFEHCGAVIAPDHDMASIMAKECFMRRGEGDHLWVVRRSAIHPVGKNEGEGMVADKSYRFASAYRDVVSKRERARSRAQGITSPSTSHADAPAAPQFPAISVRKVDR
jgi:phenylacetate-CoA oxygenase PaaH subunit